MRVGNHGDYGTSHFERGCSLYARGAAKGAWRKRYGPPHRRDSVNEVVPPEGAASNNGTLLSRKEMNCQESEMNMVPGAHLNYSPNSLV